MIGVDAPAGAVVHGGDEMSRRARGGGRDGSERVRVGSGASLRYIGLVVKVSGADDDAGADEEGEGDLEFKENDSSAEGEDDGERGSKSLHDIVAVGEMQR